MSWSSRNLPYNLFLGSSSGAKRAPLIRKAVPIFEMNVYRTISFYRHNTEKKQTSQGWQYESKGAAKDEGWDGPTH